MNDYRQDAVIGRIKAGIRFGIFIALVAALGGTVFAHALSEMLRPLLVALQTVR